MAPLDLAQVFGGSLLYAVGQGVVSGSVAAALKQDRVVPSAVVCIGGLLLGLPLMWFGAYAVVEVLLPLVADYVRSTL